MTQDTIETKTQQFLELLKTKDIRVSDAVSAFGVDIFSIVTTLKKSYDIERIWRADKVYFTMSKTNENNSN